MRRLFLLLLLAVSAHGERRILLIGNSLTYFNEAPWIVSRIANSLGMPLHADFTAGSGMTLRQHPNVAGSYLLACVIYSTVTGRSPAGATHAFDVHFEIPEFYRQSLEHDRIDAPTAAAIQSEAWRAVSGER